MVDSDKGTGNDNRGWCFDRIQSFINKIQALNYRRYLKVYTPQNTKPNELFKNSAEMRSKQKLKAQKQTKIKRVTKIAMYNNNSFTFPRC